MKKIYYWSPCLNRVGTLYSTINSAISIKKYSNKNYEPIIINACGEWDNHLKELEEEKIKIQNLCKINYYKYLPKQGYFGSRLSYLIIFLFSFIPLLKLSIKNNESILIAHLITSLPLILAMLFNTKIKLILRISGYPRLNFFRYWFWKISGRKISFITCPSNATLSKLNSINIFPKNRLVYLQDAIIRISKIRNQISKNEVGSKYILAVGRLTKQKNFIYLLNEYKKFLNVNKNLKLIILGDGEQKQELEDFCKLKKISNNVKFEGQVDNVFNFMKNAEVFVLTSLWEDPGFVIIEAGFSNLFVISSDCPNGPKEFLKDSKRGILFKNNQKNELLNSLIKFDQMKIEEKLEKKINLKKLSKNYSIFNHYLALENILNKVA